MTGSANIAGKTDVVLIWKGFVFFPWCRSRDAGSRWRASAFCHSHLKAYERENTSRTSELCHSAISSRSLTSHLLSAGFYSPLTCSRCLSQSHIKFILYAGSSQSRTDGKTIGWWEKNKSNYSFWVWGCSSISSPASTVSISRGKKAANERKVSGSGLQRAPAAVIHSALNLNLNLNRLITHPAVQMEKPVENVCCPGIFFQESACEEKRH